jgi:hypothetical protein
MAQSAISVGNTRTHSDYLVLSSLARLLKMLATLALGFASRTFNS